MLHAIIMAGGSGTRFWPASRAALPKQLLNLVGDQSMLQATVARLYQLVPPERVLVPFPCLPKEPSQGRVLLGRRRDSRRRYLPQEPPPRPRDDVRVRVRREQAGREERARPGRRGGRAALVALRRTHGRELRALALRFL